MSIDNFDSDHLIIIQPDTTEQIVVIRQALPDNKLVITELGVQGIPGPKVPPVAHLAVRVRLVAKDRLVVRDRKDHLVV